MLEAAYKAGYGKLLDLLQSKKWFALKKLGAKSKTQYTQPYRAAHSCSTTARKNKYYRHEPNSKTQMTHRF
jgi:hypothetical protein